MHYAVQLAVWHSNPPPFPSALCSLPPPLPLLLPKTLWLQTKTSWLQTLWFLCPQPSLRNLALKRLLSPPGSYLLHSRFTFFASHSPASSDPSPLISLQFSPVPAARGEKLESWYCYIMKSFQHRAGPPSEPDLQFCFLSFTHAVGITLRS